MKDATPQPPSQSGPGLGSLTQWVQRRMSPEAMPSVTTAALPAMASTVDVTGAVGQRLNGTDYELSEGLESMLPTPSIRYGVTRQRLNQQIGDLQTRITQIETALPGQDLKTVLTPLRTRLSLLQRHEGMVSRHMEYLLSQQSGAVAGGLAVMSATDQAGQWMQTKVLPAMAQAGTAASQLWQRVLPPDLAQAQRAGLSRQLGAVMALIQAMDQGQPITGREDSALRARLINQYETLNAHAVKMIEVSK